MCPSNAAEARRLSSQISEDNVAEVQRLRVLVAEKDLEIQVIFTQSSDGSFSAATIGYRKA